MTLDVGSFSVGRVNFLRAATSDNSLEDHPNSGRFSVDLYYVEESLEEEGIWI